METSTSRCMVRASLLPALIAACVAAVLMTAFAVPARSYADDLQMAPQAGVTVQNAVIESVDFGNWHDRLYDGGMPMLTAESDDARYDLYDQFWERAGDFVSCHSNPAVGSPDEEVLTTIDLGTIYYYSLTFKAKDGYVFSDDVGLTTNRGADAFDIDDGVRWVSDGGKTVTFYQFYETVGEAARQLDLTGAKLSWTERAYTGKVIAPTVKGVKLDGRAAVLGDEYQVRYSTGKSLSASPVSRNVGYYMVEIAGNNGIDGNKWLTYQIDPKGTSVKGITAGKKQLTVKWAKQAAQTSGYQIQYSTSKKFTKTTTKTVTVKKTKTTSTAIKNLKAPKKYYVRIRTFKKVASATMNSQWSPVKSATTKR